MGAISRAYLVTYNLCQTFAWSFVLFSLFKTHFFEPEPSKLTTMLTEDRKPYQNTAWIVGLAQGTAFLEVVHAATGLVRGSPATAFLQWFGRSNVLFGVMHFVPEAQTGWAVTSLFVAWAVIEVIRYPWYAIAQITEPPAFLTWLRYTMFIPLYPIGVASEVATIYKSLPTLRATRLHSLDLPNRINFAFDYYYFTMFGLFVLYPLAFPWLFSTLLRQRKKRLAPTKPKEL